MLGLSLGVFMATLDSGIVNVSLPTLMESLDTGFATVQWVILSYVLVMTSLLLIGGRMGDLLGKKRLYMTGLAVFTLGSVLCGCSPSAGWLIAFRALQGLGAVMTQSVGAALVVEIFPPSQRGRAMGIMGSVISLGIASGPPLGGLLIGLLGWRSVFLVNLPVGLAALWVIRRFLPAHPPSAQGEKLDILGSFLVMLTLTAYSLGMTLGQREGFSHPTALWLLLGSLAGLAVFLRHIRRAREPLLPPDMFRYLPFSLNLMMSSLVFIVVAASFIQPFYLELVLGYPAQTVGLLMMAVPIMMGVFSPISGHLADRIGPRWISLGGLCMVLLGCLCMGTLTRESGWLGFLWRLLPIGVGMGLFQAPNNSAIMGAVSMKRLGVAAGLLSFSRVTGFSTGVPLAGSLLTYLVFHLAGAKGELSLAQADPAAITSGVANTYLGLGALIVLAMGLAVGAIRAEKRVGKGKEDRG